ncbi:unnamed protein product [Calypogeia fissa]
MPTCFGMLYAQTKQARHLQLVIHASKDPIELLKSRHADPVVIQSYEREMEDAIAHVITGSTVGLQESPLPVKQSWLRSTHGASR